MAMSLPPSFRPSWRSQRLSSRILTPVGFLLDWASTIWVRECLFGQKTGINWIQQGEFMSQAVLEESTCPLTPWTSPLGKGEAIEAILAALEVVSEPFRSFANTLVDVCAYAGLCVCSSSGTCHFFLGPPFLVILNRLRFFSLCS